MCNHGQALAGFSSPHGGGVALLAADPPPRCLPPAGEDKFRRVRLTNPAIQQRVAAFTGAVDFLLLAGFQRDDSGEGLEMPADKVGGGDGVCVCVCVGWGGGGGWGGVWGQLLSALEGPLAACSLGVCAPG